MDLEYLGKTILMFALILLIVGGMFYLLGKGFEVKRLPGDILYRRGGFTFYFPLGACIVISLALTVLLNLLFIILRR